MSATPSGQVVTGVFSAAGPALGYLVQVEYALLLLLHRMDEADDCAASIETLDDVTFHDGQGTPTEKLQTKHHVNKTSSLSNASSDLWKTLGNWLADRRFVQQLVLLSTDAVAADSAAQCLTGSTSVRNIARADEILARTAQTSQNADNRLHYAKYLSLNQEDRLAFLDTVTILDSAVRADGLTDSIHRAMRKSVRAERRTSLVERLRGWWHGRALEHLLKVARGQPDTITSIEVEDQIHSIAQSLRDASLPIDFDDHPEPTGEEVDADTRTFVEQLRLIMLGSGRLRQCIYDHNRAYLQRSQWQRERLLHVGELERYDRRIQEEWRRHFTPLTDDDGALPESARLERARNTFYKLDTSSLPSIRTDVSEAYVANGSLHILADRLQIGWHPDWISHLRHRIEEVGISAEETPA